MAPHIKLPMDTNSFEQRRTELQSKAQCRFCLKTDANLCYIYSGKDLSQMLLASFNHPILKEDPMPRYCCEMCHKTIVICQRFRVILETSERLFTEFSSGQSERCPDSALLSDALRSGAECRLTDHTERGIKRADSSHPVIQSGIGRKKVVHASTVNPDDYVELFVVIPSQEACISTVDDTHNTTELRSQPDTKPTLRRTNYSKTDGRNVPLESKDTPQPTVTDQAQPRMLEPGSKVLKFLIPYKQEKNLQLEQGVNVVIASLRELKIKKDSRKNQ